MSFRRENNDETRPRFGRYSVLRENFVKDLILATIFLLSFAGSFLIGWDIWVVPSAYNPQTVLYCAGFSLLIGIVITVPINFIIKIIQRAIQERNRKKELVKDEKDFLEQ